MPYILNSNSDNKILVYHYGGRGSGIRRRRGVGCQDFVKIKKIILEQRRLFEDEEFPAEDAFIFLKGETTELRTQFGDAKVHWKRPHEICKDPHFLIQDGSRFDVQQGSIGNCWLVSAVAALPLNSCVFKQVVPEDNGDFDKKKKNGGGYCGLFHFRIWQYGRWVDVVVDDRLPCTEEGQLLFMHSAEKNEFWSALLEKSYAKLHGSYEALSGGLSYEALEDFTGGVAQVLMASAEEPFPPEIFTILLKAHERSALVGCSTPNAQDGTIEGKGPKGLVLGHAYSVTDCRAVEIPTPAGKTKMSLLRVRNPWGQESEWEGDWSDSSIIWKFIPDNIKKELDLTFDPDGEFWVSFEDFAKNFQTLEIVYLSPDTVDFDIEDETTVEKKKGGKIKRKKFRTSFFEGAWVSGLTAGGPISDPEKFALNPQYMIELEEADDGDEECAIIIALMQKNRRSQKDKFGPNEDLLPIRFDVFKVPNPAELSQPFPASFFQSSTSYTAESPYDWLREKSDALKLPKGSYCIVPSVAEAEIESKFILRVFSETKNNLKANEDSDVRLGGGRSEQAQVDPNSNLALSPNQEIGRQEPRSFLDKFFNAMLCFDPCAQVTDIDLRGSAAAAATAAGGGHTILVGRLKEYFKTVAGPVDKEINAEQLAQIFDLAFRKEYDVEGLSVEVCRSLIALEDVNKSGTLDVDEFLLLWKRIALWITWFKEHDKDNSGYLDSSELRQSLANAGHYVPTKILQSFVIGCGNKERRISFRLLTTFMLKLQAMTEIFEEHDLEDSGKAIFTLDQWLEFALLIS